MRTQTGVPGSAAARLDGSVDLIGGSTQCGGERGVLSSAVRVSCQRTVLTPSGRAPILGGFMGAPAAAPKLFLAIARGRLR